MRLDRPRTCVRTESISSRQTHGPSFRIDICGNLNLKSSVRPVHHTQELAGGKFDTRLDIRFLKPQVQNLKETFSKRGVHSTHPRQPYICSATS